MPPLMREFLYDPYIRMYQIKDILVTTIQNGCLYQILDIRSNVRYYNVNGKPQTPKWGGLHMDKKEDSKTKIINIITQIDDEELLRRIYLILLVIFQG